jgi:hypothetical protein
LDINAIKIAKELWEASHARSTPIIEADISQANGDGSPDKANSSGLPASREPPWPPPGKLPPIVSMHKIKACTHKLKLLSNG